MEYEVIRENGKVVSIQCGNRFIPICDDNYDYKAFLAWNAQQDHPLDLSDYPPDLNSNKLKRVGEIDRIVNLFVEDHYSQHRQQTITLLYFEAQAAGLTARAAYIKQGIDWVKTCLGYYYVLEDMVRNAKTVEEVNAVQPNFAPLAAIDPVITIREALLYGVSAPSGTSGTSGSSGASGESAFSGFSGESNYSGFSDISGFSGFSDVSGFSGFSDNGLRNIPGTPEFRAAHPEYSGFSG